MTQELTPQQYWSTRTSCSIVEEGCFLQYILEKHLDKDAGKICLEIGCVPGALLARLCKTFGYYPEGIDYVWGSKLITGKTLENHGIYNYKIYEEDFIAWQAPKQYDVVCSFGFIEHFDDPGPIIQKHVDLVKTGGRLIIEIPNLAHGQYLLHFILDRKTLKLHNTRIMNLPYFEKIADQYHLKIDYLGYAGGPFKFWWENTTPSRWQRFIYDKIIIYQGYITKLIQILHIKSDYFSPYILLVAEKI